MIIIIGGGLAGLSTAYHLAKRGAKVTVLERERKIGFHASGNNAGMIRQTVSDPVLAGLAACGQNKLARFKGIGFRPNGSLLVSSKKDRQIFSIKAVAQKNKIACALLDAQAAVKKVPALRGVGFDRALFCPKDALVEVKPLLKGLEKSCRALGVRVALGAPLESVSRNGSHFKVLAGGRTYVAEKLVNAAGGWADEVARISGASKLPLKPYLRHLYESAAFRGRNADWPFVWDLGRELYFRPLTGGLLLSPCDKLFVNGVRTDSAAADQAARRSLESKLKSFGRNFEGLKLNRKKFGLRTMAPDGRFVIGEDPELKNFFWVAGLGGHGVTTSLSVGNLAARLVLGLKVDAKTARWASPARFR